MLVESERAAIVLCDPGLTYRSRKSGKKRMLLLTVQSVLLLLINYILMRALHICSDACSKIDTTTDKVNNTNSLPQCVNKISANHKSAQTTS